MTRNNVLGAYGFTDEQRKKYERSPEEAQKLRNEARYQVSGDSRYQENGEVEDVFTKNTQQEAPLQNVGNPVPSEDITSLRRNANTLKNTQSGDREVNIGGKRTFTNLATPEAQRITDPANTNKDGFAIRGEGLGDVSKRDFSSAGGKGRKLDRLDGRVVFTDENGNSQNETDAWIKNRLADSKHRAEMTRLRGEMSRKGKTGPGSVVTLGGGVLARNQEIIAQRNKAAQDQAVAVEAQKGRNKLAEQAAQTNVLGEGDSLVQGGRVIAQGAEKQRDFKLPKSVDSVFKKLDDATGAETYDIDALAEYQEYLQTNKLNPTPASLSQFFREYEAYYKKPHPLKQNTSAL